MVTHEDTYNINGTRKELLLNPSKSLSEGRLIAINGYDALVNAINKLKGEDIIAIYTSNIGTPPTSDSGAEILDENFINMFFLRGHLDGVKENNLFFKGPGGKSLLGVEYSGSPWPVLIPTLVEVIRVSNINLNSKEISRDYNFNTVYNIPLGAVSGHNSINAYLNLVANKGSLWEAKQNNSLFPVRLVSITTIVDPE